MSTPRVVPSRQCQGKQCPIPGVQKRGRSPRSRRTRRRRVLRAALELAAEGGYDGVQMREVAERAEVALGTVYHYFTSKDHLLAESMTEWLSGLEASIARRPAEGDTTLERVLDILRRTTRGMAENQQGQRRVDRRTGGRGPARGGEPAGAPRGVQRHARARRSPPTSRPTPRDKIIRSLEHIWFSELIAWKNGWNPYEQSAQELEDAAVLFLAQVDDAVIHLVLLLLGQAGGSPEPGERREETGMKKTLKIVAALASVVMLAAACGDDGGGGSAVAADDPLVQAIVDDIMSDSDGITTERAEAECFVGNVVGSIGKDRLTALGVSETNIADLDEIDWTEDEARAVVDNMFGCMDLTDNFIDSMELGELDAAQRECVSGVFSEDVLKDFFLATFTR